MLTRKKGQVESWTVLRKTKASSYSMDQNSDRDQSTQEASEIFLISTHSKAEPVDRRAHDHEAQSIQTCQCMHIGRLRQPQGNCTTEHEHINLSNIDLAQQLAASKRNGSGQDMQFAGTTVEEHISSTLQKPMRFQILNQHIIGENEHMRRQARIRAQQHQPRLSHQNSFQHNISLDSPQVTGIVQRSNTKVPSSRRAADTCQTGMLLLVWLWDITMKGTSVMRVPSVRLVKNA